MEQNGSEEVDNNKDVRVLIVKDRKILITTTSVIPVSRKLSTS